MKITINGETVGTEHLNQWKLKRISKVLKTINRKIAPAETAEEANAELSEIKQAYSYGEMLALLKGRLSPRCFDDESDERPPRNTRG